MRRPRYTAEKVANAILESEGIKSVAARKLKCNRRTIDEYIKRYPTCKTAYEDAFETTGDLCESALMKLVHKGNPSAIIFALKTLFKGRGYGTKESLEPKKGFSFQIDLGKPEDYK
jgi:hypothetical protein